jgi:uncharacterized protein (TIGR03083 family)
MASTITVPAAPVRTSIEHVRRETRRFVEVAAQSPLQAHVPAYPAFTVETLSAHIGRALRLFHDLLAGSAGLAGQPVTLDQLPEAPAGSAVVDWAEAGLEPLVRLVGEIDPGTLVPFPHDAGDKPAWQVPAALAVEIGVHRWDVESVLGDHAPIPQDLAVSEIETVFANFAPRLAGSDVAAIGGTVQLHATDAGITWAVSVQDGRLVTARLEPGEPAADVTVSATAADLALVVWKRALPPRAGVEVSGQRDVLRRFLSTDYIPDPRTTPAH